MIFEEPGGYGYGLFDKNYNIAQEEYFSSKTNTTFEERKNARHVITGYNDYIEQSIEGGIAGGLFITAFYALFILTSIRNKDIPALSIAVYFSRHVCFLHIDIYPSDMDYFDKLLCHDSRKDESRR